jgi:hypothetical protein
MTGAIIQLIAHGRDNVYLTHDPQITFFKVIYRRHTNFTKEQIPQSFIKQPNFGKKGSSIISKRADLLGGIQIVTTLPKIQTTSDEKAKFAWVKRVGFALIKSVEIEIGGKIIDRHYGEWLNIWSELTGKINGNHKSGMKKLIGDVPELTEFTSSKNEYTLYIPLQFWFCKNSGNALPLISLQYSDVKINVEFEDASKCYMLSPTHYIKCRDDIVNFTPFEYIEQNIDGTIAAGIFIEYDINFKRLYYYKLTSTKLASVPVASDFNTSASNSVAITALLASSQGLKYSIIGKTSGYSTFAEFNNTTTTHSVAKIRNLSMTQCYLLVDYYYLDEEERYKFSQSKHDYLIDQLYYTPDIEIENANFSSPIIAEHPCKLIAWITQLKYIKSSNDHYNYTDSYRNKILSSESSTANIGDPVSKSLISTQTILMNGNPRVSLRDASYFDKIQMHMHTSCNISTGINMYSYAEHPFIHQPSGSCNMSQIDNVKIQLNLSPIVSVNNKALFRAYSVCTNILRISSGLAGTVFLK